MKRIGIERDRKRGSAGLIEGETDDGRRWIMFLDELGSPDVFWPDRDDSGAVQGAPVLLVRQQTSWAREGGKLEALSEPVMAPVGGEHIVSTFPVFTPEEFPRQAGDDPTDYTGLKRGVVFCVAQPGEDRGEAMKAFVYELAGYYEAEDAIAEEASDGE